jgi:hypothetical protein
MTQDHGVTVTELIALTLKRHGGEFIFPLGLPSAVIQGRHLADRLPSGKHGRRHGNVSARRCVTVSAGAAASSLLPASGLQILLSRRAQVGPRVA